MLIIGERINASRKTIRQAIEKKDADFIKQEAVLQVKAGADCIDVNCGFDPDAEVSNMEWLVKTVQEAIDKPLCIDSPNPEAIKAGVKLHKGKALVNSISGEGKRADTILPLVKEYGAGIVALTIDDNGMPKTAEERLKIARDLAGKTNLYKIPREDVYFDLLVRSVATEAEQGMELLKSIALVKSELGMKTIGAISNISFGLPNRAMLNAAFLSMCISYGLDAVILDIICLEVKASLRAAEALAGTDEYCLRYINDIREGKLS